MPKVFVIDIFMYKFAGLPIPDNIYNWLVEFFQGHSHCTKYGHQISACKEITASIVQGANYKKILRLSYDVIITYDNRKSNLR